MKFLCWSSDVTAAFAGLCCNTLKMILVHENFFALLFQFELVSCTCDQCWVTRVKYSSRVKLEFFYGYSAITWVKFGLLVPLVRVIPSSIRLILVWILARFFSVFCIFCKIDWGTPEPPFRSRRWSLFGRRVRTVFEHWTTDQPFGLIWSSSPITISYGFPGAGYCFTNPTVMLAVYLKCTRFSRVSHVTLHVLLLVLVLTLLESLEWLKHRHAPIIACNAVCMGIWIMKRTHNLSRVVPSVENPVWRPAQEHFAKAANKTANGEAEMKRG